MRKYESNTSMSFIAARVVYTILFNLEKRLQEDWQRQLGSKSARKICVLANAVPDMVNWIDWVAITHNALPLCVVAD